MKRLLYKLSFVLLLLSFSVDSASYFFKNKEAISFESNTEENGREKSMEEEVGKDKVSHYFNSSMINLVVLNYFVSSNVSLFISHHPQLPEIPPEKI